MSCDACKLRKMFAMAQYLPTLRPVSPSLFVVQRGSWGEPPGSYHPSFIQCLPSRSERSSTGHDEVKTQKLCRKQSWASRRKAYSEKRCGISEADSTGKEASRESFHKSVCILRQGDRSIAVSSRVRGRVGIHGGTDRRIAGDAVSRARARTTRF